MSDDRLFATSYRYEVRNPNAKMLQKALTLQKSRIETDEKIAHRTEVENLVSSELERARWFSSLEEDSEKRRQKREKELADDELKMANEQFIKIRRARLKKLLTEENIQYEKELNGFGKAFYKKRI
ncbi:cilia- and flagella-associated protein 141 [Pocillopora verrucosa]|uniref:cilia- and flagella-associated protein 141 n=1 Tax=Pocillopora verrucosa TaxID=203993 RepID=UPI002797B235|nr:cilia- and flagella-associated protein 141-like [Pocillopora verrucosa]